MDQLVQTYQRAIMELLEEYAAIKPAGEPPTELMILADRERNHFSLVRLGWENQQFIYHTVMHFDIIGGKVWLQQNWTDQDLAEELVAKGIKRDDIVLGFVPPYARGATGYATA